MGLLTNISWCDHTFNAVWGCTKFSPGCRYCFADSFSARTGHPGLWERGGKRRLFGKDHWDEPLKWNRIQKPGVMGIPGKQLVFCGSMFDVFEDHPVVQDEMQKLWPLIRATPGLTWQLLTKRSKRIAQYLPSDWSVQNYPNVWLGVSVENDDYADRIDHLRDIPAVVRFVSYEPAIGPIPSADLKDIHWLICGGETGNVFRPMNHDWAREAQRKCLASGTAFFFKQSSALRPGKGTLLDGRQYFNFPDDKFACLWKEPTKQQELL